MLSGIKEPVDGAFLVDFLVVLEEIGEEVIADDLSAGVPLVTQGIGNELEIFLQGILPINDLHKGYKPADNIVLKIGGVGNGNAVVSIRQVSAVFAVIPLAACIGKPLHIQRVTSKHTAHGVGDQGDNFIPHGADVIAPFHTLRHIVFAVIHPVDSNVLVRYLRGQFVLQAVNVNENAVEFFFVLFKLLEAGFAFLLPGGVFIGNQFSHINFPSDNSVNALLIRLQVGFKLVAS